MAFSYNKLWKILIDRKMMKKDLDGWATGLTTTTMAKQAKNCRSAWTFWRAYVRLSGVILGISSITLMKKNK